MPNLLFATIVAAGLLLSAAPAVCGDKNEGAERQQAIEHSREVHRMKEHTREQEWQMRNQAEKDRTKVKEKVKEKAEEKAEEEAEIVEEDEG